MSEAILCNSFVCYYGYKFSSTLEDKSIIPKSSFLFVKVQSVCVSKSKLGSGISFLSQGK